jgi:TadE-like protein
MSSTKQASSSRRHSRKGVASRLRRLHRTRGAAMVEAAIVLPVLTLFLGLMMFVRAQYSAKLFAMADARQNAWDRAVHAQCGGGSGGGSTPSLEVGDPPNGTKDKVISPGPSEGAKRQGMDKILRKVEWSANATTSVSRYSGTVSSRSYVFCNEDNYGDGGGVVGMFKGFVGFVSSFWKGGLL